MLFSAGGGTSFGSAIDLLTDTIGKSNLSNVAIVFMTDGGDTSGAAILKKATGK